MYQGMQYHDKNAVRKLVRELLRRNLSLVVSDEEWTERPSTDYDSIMDSLGNSDLNRIAVYDGQTKLGTFLLIYGNCPGETISDCTANAFCDGVCAAIGEAI